jgi:hypothetical protein
MSATNVVRLPVAMKRGRKVRCGPCAQIIALSVAPRTAGEALDRYMAESNAAGDDWRKKKEAMDRLATSIQRLCESQG